MPSTMLNHSPFIFGAYSTVPKELTQRAYTLNIPKYFKEGLETSGLFWSLGKSQVTAFQNQLKTELALRGS